MSRLIIAALAVMLPLGALDAQSVKPKHKSIDAKTACEKPPSTMVDRSGKQAGVRKLGDMPPAKQYLTALREVDGCPKPVVLREGIGG